jgi:hypothetical protein
LSQGPDIWLTPVQAVYFLVTGDNLATVSHRSDEVLIAPLGRSRSAFAPLSAAAGLEERAAALKEAKERLRMVHENPCAVANKQLASLLAAGLVAAQGRRSPSRAYENIEPVEFSDLRLAGSHLENATMDIVFYNVRLSGWDLDRSRRQLMASDEMEHASSPLPNAGVITRRAENTALGQPSAGPKAAPSPVGASPSAKARRGPTKGSIDRYGEADRALFPELEQVRREHHLSPTEAALRLAEGKIEGKVVLGNGSPLSRAKRLVMRYNADRRTHLKPAEGL